MKKLIKGILIVLLVLLAIGGIGWALGYQYVPAYDHSGSYTAGAATLDGGIKGLDIDWISGEVEIAYHAEDTVEISETANKSLSGGQELRWWLDGDTLRVRWAKPGLVRMRGIEKHLTVTLPEGTRLDTATLETTSGTLTVPGIEAETLSLSVTSGDIHASASARTIAVGATSGSVDLTQTGDAQSVTLKTTSGGIGASLENVESLQAKVTSGGIGVQVSGTAGSVSLETTSGGISADIANTGSVWMKATSGALSARLGGFESLEIEATSGDVKAALPTEPGFRAEVSTTSGDFESDIPLSMQDGAYTCGDGSASVRIHVTSGNVRLEKAE